MCVEWRSMFMLHILYQSQVTIVWNTRETGYIYHLNIDTKISMHSMIYFIFSLGHSGCLRLPLNRFRVEPVFSFLAFSSILCLSLYDSWFNFSLHYSFSQVCPPLLVASALEWYKREDNFQNEISWKEWKLIAVAAKIRTAVLSCGWLKRIMLYIARPPVHNNVNYFFEFFWFIVGFHNQQWWPRGLRRYLKFK